MRADIRPESEEAKHQVQELSNTYNRALSLADVFGTLPQPSCEDGLGKSCHFLG